MKLIISIFFFLILLLLSRCIVPQKEYQAIVDFYFSLEGNNWTKKTDWLNGDPCVQNWFGLSCNNPNKNDKYHHITGIFLSNNKLKGKLPQSIGELVFMDSLDLGHNLIKSEIPQGFLLLNKLEGLSFRENQFYGSLKNLPISLKWLKKKK
jgi:hypothetical protein